MKFWPFEKRESSYTDAIITAILANAQGKSLAATPAATSALEACAGTTGRGFAAAEVSGGHSITQALTPAVLSLIGRELIRTGEAIFMIDTNTGLKLLPAQSWDIEGGPDPGSWQYSLTLGGPSRTHTHNHIPGTSVLHFKYSVDPSRPWRGNSPLQVATLAGKLSAETVRSLGDESSGPVGNLLGIPADGADASVQALKADIANARGRTAMIEIGDWGNSGGDAKVDLQTKRFGAEPPASLVELVDVSSREIYAACGFNGALWGGSSSAAVREAWRLALFGVLAPLGRLVESELQDKLEDTVKLSWQELRASDLSGRARSVQSLVGAGVSVQAAAKEAGLMVDFQAEPAPMVEED